MQELFFEDGGHDLGCDGGWGELAGRGWEGGEVDVAELRLYGITWALRNVPLRGCSRTDFPVMNMHPHAWPLYSAAKLLGVEFHETGMNLRPTLPLDEYEFRSPLMGFSKSKAGYEGWYSPSVAGRWEIALALPAAEAERMKQLSVNGSKEQLSKSAGLIRFKGTSAPESPLRWHVS